MPERAEDDSYSLPVMDNFKSLYFNILDCAASSIEYEISDFVENMRYLQDRAVLTPKYLDFRISVFLSLY
jgi:hypothetical protein